MTPRGHKELCNNGMVLPVQQELPQRAAASSIKQRVTASPINGGEQSQTHKYLDCQDLALWMQLY